MSAALSLVHLGKFVAAAKFIALVLVVGEDFSISRSGAGYFMQVGAVQKLPELPETTWTRIVFT